MQQAIMIDALGRIVGEHREDNKVDMSTFGRQHITRFSEVVFNDYAQRWYVSFRSGAPREYWGKAMSVELVEQAGVPAGLWYAERIPAPDTPVGVAVPTFERYSDAVTAERLVLRWMMSTGAFSG